MAGKEVKVSVVAETRKFETAMRRLAHGSGLNDFKAGLANLGRAAAVGAAAIGTAVGAVGVKLAAFGANLEQSTGAVSDVFKTAADEMHGYASKAATSVGLSTNAYNELATVLGSQLKNAGTPIEQLAGKTNDLIGVGADLAAMFGGTTQDAVNALSSALKGERDPIERYGVSLKQASIDAKAAELGFQKVGGSFDQEAQTAATLALIMEQTTDAHGKFAREGATLAHQVQVWKARLETFGQTVGAHIIPPITELAAHLGETLGPKLDQFAQWITAVAIPAVQQFAATFATEWIPRIQQAAQWIQANILPALSSLAATVTGTVLPAARDIGSWIVDNAANIAPFAAAIGSIVAAWKAWTTALRIWKTIQLAATAVQAAFNVVAAMNPIGLIVLAIVAVVAGIATFIATHEDARNKLAEIWDAIKSAIAVAADGIKSAIAWLGDLPAKIGQWFNGAKTAALQAWDNLVADAIALPGRVISGLASLGALLGDSARRHFTMLVTGAQNVVGSLFSFVSSIPGRILSGLGNLGNLLYSAGSDLVSGMVRGLTNAAGRLVQSAKDMASNAVNAVKNALGIHSPSRVFMQLGEYTGEGWINGLQAMSARAQAAAQRLVTIPTPRVPNVSGVGTIASAGGAAQIIINVSTLVPTLETGRLIADALDTYLALNGRRTAMGAIS